MPSCSRTTRRTMSSGSTSTAKSRRFSTSSLIRASNFTVPTMPTLRPKLRKLARRSFSMAMAFDLRPPLRTSFHHQPEAQHPNFFSYPQADRPITPSFGCIATEASFSRHVESDRRAVIQDPDWRGRIMRYELTDDEWVAIKPMLPNKPRGVPRVNDRRVLNGIFWGAMARPARRRRVPPVRPAPARLGLSRALSSEKRWVKKLKL